VSPSSSSPHLELATAPLRGERRLSGVFEDIGVHRDLEDQLNEERARSAAFLKENRFMGRLLADRDRQLSDLQVEFKAIRRVRFWRVFADLRRMGRHFRAAVGI
jgi:hypothetical protein